MQSKESKQDKKDDEALVELKEMKLLAPFQLTGTQFLLDAYQKARSAVLGDLPGLGKTRQVLAALWVLLKRSEVTTADGPRFLLAVPRPALKVWQREAANFSGMLEAMFFYHHRYGAILPKRGSKKWRTKRIVVLTYAGLSNLDDNVQAKQVKLGARKEVSFSKKERQLTAEQSRSQWLLRHPFDAVWGDEAHCLRNFVVSKSRWGKTSVRISDKLGIGVTIYFLKYNMFFAITGTPMFNDIYDLVSLDILMAHDVKRLDWWLLRYARMFGGGGGGEGFRKDPEVAAWLRKHLLSRSKDDPIVKPQLEKIIGCALPPTEHHVVATQMHAKQRAMERAVISDLAKIVAAKESFAEVLVRILYLRRLAVSSRLLPTEVVEAMQPAYNKLLLEEKHRAPDPVFSLDSLCREFDTLAALVDCDDDDGSSSGQYDMLEVSRERRRRMQAIDAPAILCESAKLLAVVREVYKHLKRPKSEGILIFCEWTDAANLLAELLGAVLYPLIDKPPIYHGKVSDKKRDEMIDSFQDILAGAESKVCADQRVVILTTAGSECVTLTAATRVINLTPDYAPLKWKQKTGRADRVGQKRVVHIVDLINGDKNSATTEQWVVNRGQSKIQRGREILDGLKTYSANFERMTGSAKAKANFSFADVCRLIELFVADDAHARRQPQEKKTKTPPTTITKAAQKKPVRQIEIESSSSSDEEDNSEGELQVIPAPTSLTRVDRPIIDLTRRSSSDRDVKEVKRTQPATKPNAFSGSSSSTLGSASTSTRPSFSPFGLGHEHSSRPVNRLSGIKRKSSAKQRLREMLGMPAAKRPRT